jgi:hypothetical protein
VSNGAIDAVSISQQLVDQRQNNPFEPERTKTAAGTDTSVVFQAPGTAQAGLYSAQTQRFPGRIMQVLVLRWWTSVAI